MGHGVEDHFLCFSGRGLTFPPATGTVSELFLALKSSLKASERSREMFGGLLAIGRHDVSITHVVECDSHHKIMFVDNVPTKTPKENVDLSVAATPEIYFRFATKSGDYMSSYRPLIGYLKAGDITVEQARDGKLHIEEINGTSYYMDANNRKVPGKRATQDALDQIRDIVAAAGMENFDNEALVGKTISLEIYPKPEFKGESRLEAGYFRVPGTTSLCYRAPKASASAPVAKVAEPETFKSPDDLPY